MKTYLALALGLACFITPSSLRAAGDMVRAAVITKDINAELRSTDSSRSAGRESFNVGEIHEIVATDGRHEQLKVDATHVALVPTSALRIRQCTRSEFSEAQAKFSALKTEEYREARKKISANKKQAIGAASAAACSSCPKVLASAQNRISAADKAYREQNQALRLKLENLAKEALEWAAAGSLSTAAQ